MRSINMTVDVDVDIDDFLDDLSREERVYVLDQLDHVDRVSEELRDLHRDLEVWRRQYAQHDDALRTICIRFERELEQRRAPARRLLARRGPAPTPILEGEA